MRRNPSVNAAIDYRDFSDPFFGIAAMIFVQADQDLKRMGKETHYITNGDIVYKAEVKRFLRSGWALALADALKLDTRDLAAYAAAV